MDKPRCLTHAVLSLLTVKCKHSAVGLSLSLTLRSGSHLQTNCELTLVIGLRQLRKLFCSALTTRVYGALGGGLCDDAQ